MIVNRYKKRKCRCYSVLRMIMVMMKIDSEMSVGIDCFFVFWRWWMMLVGCGRLKKS